MGAAESRAGGCSEGCFALRPGRRRGIQVPGPLAEEAASQKVEARAICRAAASSAPVAGEPRQILQGEEAKATAASLKDRRQEGGLSGVHGQLAAAQMPPEVPADLRPKEEERGAASSRMAVAERVMQEAVDEELARSRAEEEEQVRRAEELEASRIEEEALQEAEEARLALEAMEAARIEQELAERRQTELEQELEEKRQWELRQELEEKRERELEAQRERELEEQRKRQGQEVQEWTSSRMVPDELKPCSKQGLQGVARAPQRAEQLEEAMVLARQRLPREGSEAQLDEGRPAREDRTEEERRRAQAPEKPGRSPRAAAQAKQWLPREGSEAQLAEARKERPAARLWKVQEAEEAKAAPQPGLCSFMSCMAQHCDLAEEEGFE